MHSSSSSNQALQFTRLLLQWNDEFNSREMPWKNEKNPYKIWLSEVILQQTRVEQGLPYYNKIIQQYPTVTALAKAKDETVFKLWEGLGYYSRCRNLLATARMVANEMDGIFPTAYTSLLNLKGVGTYTAAAIASFAYNLPYAVVDGNVYRVLSRIFDLDTATDSKEGKELFATLAQKLIDKELPGKYNQAIMDFGATVCKPALPNCNVCTLNTICKAYKHGTVNLLPIKEKQLKKKHRIFYYFVFQHKNQFLINQRTTKDIWQNLHEFYLMESPKTIHWNKANIAEWLEQQLSVKEGFVVENISSELSQQLTHQKITSKFILITLDKIPTTLSTYNWITKAAAKNLAFPKLLNDYLNGSAVLK